MSENSKIEWTDHTFNPWIGCTRVSPGCDHCYAAVSTPARAMHVAWGANEPRHRTAPTTWKDPIKWNARHDAFFAEHGRRQRVFCASLADVFDNAVDPMWRSDLFDLIARTPNLDWLLLTKRIGNVMPMLRDLAPTGDREDRLSRMQDTPEHWGHCIAYDWVNGRPPANVWLGATIVNQAEADRDIPKLLAVPARRRFLSIEPLLGPVKLPRFCACGCNKPLDQAVREAMDGPSALNRWQAESAIPITMGIDWVIVGGESGRDARPVHPDWVKSLRAQCAVADVPFLFKQWGEWLPDDQNPAVAVPNDPSGAIRVGKKAAGRELDGHTHDEFPEAQ